jgi:hypothetical protein
MRTWKEEADPTAINFQLKQKTHRMLAWGVLGSASDGLPFLLTHPVVFRSMYNELNTGTGLSYV